MTTKRLWFGKASPKLNSNTNRIPDMGTSPATRQNAGSGLTPKEAGAKIDRGSLYFFRNTKEGIYDS
jgi:hypothetical protein